MVQVPVWKEGMPDKPKILISRFRTKCVLVSIGLVLWWSLVVVRFSYDRRPLPLQTSIGQPLRSLHKDDTEPRESPIGTSQQDYSTSAEGFSGIEVLESNKTWHTNSEGCQDESNGDKKLDCVLSPGERMPPVIAVSQSHSAEKPSPFVEQPVKDLCEGRYVYVYELDPCFNEDFVTQCEKVLWETMCPSVTNAGLGPPLDNIDDVLSDLDWYATNQFMLELIFHNRMRQYKCLIRDSSRADAIFVPFYAGLEITTKLWGANIAERDDAPEKLQSWLANRAEWKRFNGHDHFLVAGRITWDFRRPSDQETDWGNKLFVSPLGANMTFLTIEASTWDDNDFAIPYPTYFHPSSKTSIVHWQNKMRAIDRPFLFSFVGAPRPALSYSIRGNIVNQCIHSNHCRLLDCRENVCTMPEKVMEVFEHSIFCLQPPGDSYTRRSTFDAMLAGCIPVFFHPYSAYVQYEWHLPINHSSYSVLIDERLILNNTIRIEEVLLKFTPEQIVNMRRMVIHILPRIVYADPRLPSPLPDVEDAFDITLQVIGCH